MGTLRESSSGRAVTLPARAVVGRARGSDVEIGLRSVSGQHATVRWTGSEWEVVDLGSRNGTSVDGHRLAPGERGRLRAGAELRFGREAPAWVMDEDGPPGLMAQDLGGGASVLGEGGYLVLPDAQRAEVGIFQDERGQWQSEVRGEVAAIEDGAVITTSEGRAWRVCLPSASEGTVRETSGLMTVAGLRLRFAFTRDEEHVEVSAQVGARSFDLKARAHHYPLLVLARQRLADRRAGAPAAEEGWIRQDELVRMLRIDDNHLNICIHRARQQLGQVGVADAAALVERRTGSRQVRIGVADLEVAPIDGGP